MTKLERTVNIITVVVPFVAFVAAVVLLWQQYVDGLDLAIMAFMYLITGFGVTVGYHRLFTHRAFETSKPVRYFFAIAGSMAVQGPVIDWVADHRKHHAHSDRDGDPHSPHGHGGGLKGALSGLYYAHMGWLAHTQGQAEKRRYAKDLFEDQGLRTINRKFLWILGLGLLIPFALGGILGGTISDALTALLWGGFVRIFFLHHVTWSINSVCHFFGSKRFITKDHSGNVGWLSILSLGESWHHNHHAFPRSARHGLRWYEVDPSAMLIAAMKKLGLVWDVVTVSPEVQRKRSLATSETAQA